MIKQTMVVFFKEMKDILRDKKTFIVSLILPLLFLPTILFIVDHALGSSKSQSEIRVSIGVNKADNSFYEFCRGVDNVDVFVLADSKSAMESGKIAAYANISDTLDQHIVNKEDTSKDLNVDFNSSSINAMMSIPLATYYKELFSIMTSYLVEEKYASSVEELKAMVSNKELLDLFKTVYPYSSNDGFNIDTSSLYFNMLVPMMLIFYCCIGSAGTATDLSAGEKERGTLEALLSTGTSRTSIIIGKLFATTVMGMISGLCTVLGLSVYLVASSSSAALNLSFFNLMSLLVVTLFTSMTFAAINLAIGVYSKSAKEAQTYLLPVSMISILPSYFIYTLDVSLIDIRYLCIPIINIVCIIKEVFAGAVNYLHFGIVILWLIVYISIACSIATKMFKKENVVFRI